MPLMGWAYRDEAKPLLGFLSFLLIMKRLSSYSLSIKPCESDIR